MTQPPHASPRSLRTAGITLVVAVQVICSGFFFLNIIGSTIGFGARPIPWQLREIFEIGAAIGMALGVAAGLVLLSATLRRNRRVEDQLRAASGAFADLMEERFAEWALTEAERDVALFTLKGFSNTEIATLRGRSEGTIKAQGNAIYRKAGVGGRAQLLGLFVEDLMAGISPAPVPQPKGRNDTLQK